MFGRRRPKTPQGAGSPSAVSRSHTAPGLADVEVTGVVAPTPAPRPAVYPDTSGRRLVLIYAQWIDDRWLGHQVMTGEHIGWLMGYEQHPTAHRTVLHLAASDGIETVDIHDHTTVTTDPQGVMK